MNKKWLKENWFKVGMLIIGIGIIYSLQINTDTQVKEGSISALEYKTLNDECKEYGLEEWGEMYTSYAEGLVTRKYKYSTVLDTCIMRAEERFEDFTTVELRDIYFDKELISFDSFCAELGNQNGCIMRSDVINKEEEIW